MRPIRTVEVLFVDDDTIEVTFERDWYWKSGKNSRNYTLSKNETSYGLRNLSSILDKATHYDIVRSHLIGERIGRRSWGVYTKDVLGGTRYSFHPLNVAEDKRDLFLLGRTNGKKVI